MGVPQTTRKKNENRKSFLWQSSHTSHSDARLRKEEENKTGKREGLWEKYAYTNATVSELICFSEENCAEFSGQMAQWLRALAALTEDLCLVPASLWWLRTLIISFWSEQIWDPPSGMHLDSRKKMLIHIKINHLKISCSEQLWF